MIDMLVLSIEHQILDDKVQYLKDKYQLISERVCDKHYDNVQVLKTKEKHFLTIKNNPKRFISNMKPKIQVNPSRFNNHKDITNILSILNHTNSPIVLNRIDFAVDIEVALERVYSILKVKYKQMRDSYHKGCALRGVYYGANNNLTVIYDKAFLLEKNGLKFKRISQKSSELTRIEVRLKNKSIPFRSLDELSKYVDFDPFESLTFYDLLPPIGLTQLQKQRFSLFVTGCLNRGFNHTYRSYNRSSNFSKSFISKNLVLSPLNQKVREIYQSNLSTYFNG